MKSIITVPDALPRPVLDVWREATGAGGSASRHPITDSTVLHVAGRSGLAGDYQGAAAIRGLVRLLDRLAGGRLQCIPKRIIRSEDYAIVTGVLRADGDNAAIDVVFVLEFQDDEADTIWMFCQNAETLEWPGAARHS